MVSGSAQDWRSDPHLEMIFKRGLVSAAKATEAWVVTGGTDTGTSPQRMTPPMMTTVHDYPSLFRDKACNGRQVVWLLCHRVLHVSVSLPAQTQVLTSSTDLFNCRRDGDRG